MNGVFELSVKGAKHTLMFRMKAYQILQMKSAVELERSGTVDELKAFVYLVYAGMCNYAESLDLVYPEYQYCYNLVDDLLNESDSKEQQNAMYACFKASKAGEMIFDLIKQVSPESVFDEEETVKKKKAKKAIG